MVRIAASVPFQAEKIELQIEGEAKKDWRSIVVYVTFAITVLLWMSDKFTGVNSNVVAMIPVAVFCVTGVITKRDLEEISWSVLWMVAGGFALGVALQETGLAKHMIEAIPFNTWPPILMVVVQDLSAIQWPTSSHIQPQQPYWFRYWLLQE